MTYLELEEKCKYIHSMVNDCLVDLTDEGFFIGTQFEYSGEDGDNYLIVSICNIHGNPKRINDSIDDMVSHLNGEEVILISNKFSKNRNIELIFKV